jgi:hypothetical protein
MGELPEFFWCWNSKYYGYHFEQKKVDQVQAIPAFSGSTIFISQQGLWYFDLTDGWLLSVYMQTWEVF